MSATTIESEALHLPVEARARLAQLLLESLDSLSREEADKLWVDEVQRRVLEIDEGTVELVSATEMEARVKARFK